MYPFLRTACVICMCCLSPVLAQAAADDIDVSLKVEGNAVSIDVDFLVDAKPRDVWAVLTDFDHMTSFVTNLTSSKVLKRSRNKLTIEQKGKASAGPVSFDFNAVRDVQLKPYKRIRSNMVSGNMIKSEAVTDLTEEGNQTRVRYHSDSISATQIPPVVGPNFIKSETRDQFAQMRQEIVRRKQSPAK